MPVSLKSLCLILELCEQNTAPSLTKGIGPNSHYLKKILLTNFIAYCFKLQAFLVFMVAAGLIFRCVFTRFLVTDMFFAVLADRFPGTDNGGANESDSSPKKTQTIRIAEAESVQVSS